jgi:hypothetical protein
MKGIRVRPIEEKVLLHTVNKSGLLARLKRPEKSFGLFIYSAKTSLRRVDEQAIWRSPGMTMRGQKSGFVDKSRTFSSKL